MGLIENLMSPHSVDDGETFYGMFIDKIIKI